MAENLEIIIRYLKRRLRDAQNDEWKRTTMHVADIAWVLDALERMEVQLKGKGDAA